MRIITAAFVAVALVGLGACGGEEPADSPETTKAPAPNNAEWQTITVAVEGMT